MKFDFILGEVEELLEDTNVKLSNIEMLLEMILTPPDLVEYMKKKNVADTPDNRIAMYNAGPYGARKKIESGKPLVKETQRLIDTYNQFATFDPEGSDYWESLAGYMGMQPPPGQHWASREPTTGLLMKGQQHPTIDLARQADAAKGYQWIKSTSPQGYYHSVPVAPPNYYKNN